MKTILVKTNPSYPVVIQRGGLAKANEVFALDRKVLILTDTMIPDEYSQAIASCCKEPFIYKIEAGEQSKCLASFEAVLMHMLNNGFSRKDAVVSVGGGVVGDLGGFVASTYMRGVDFYNVPTSLLAMVDSSIGGKTAVDLGNVKNIVGTFYQPKAVLIDPDVLKTLDKRQYRSGLVETIKMAATFDASFFDEILNGNPDEESIIEHSLNYKRIVVEQDEKETGLRKVLNFGHTLGHAFEEASNLSLFHGEAVGLGMLCCSKGEAKEKIKMALEKYGCPVSLKMEKEKLRAFLSHDKKAAGNTVSAILCEQIGTYRIVSLTIDEVLNLYPKGGLQ